MDKNFVSAHNIPTLELKKPRTIEVIDGRTISSQKVTHLAHSTLKINSHKELASFFIIKLQYPLVLGIPWLQRHDVTLGFKKHTISFKSKFCKFNCSSNNRPIPCLPRETGKTHPLPPPISISAMDVQSFADLTRVENLQLYAGWLNPDGYLETKALQLHRLDTSPIETNKVVPEEYHEFLNLFSEEEAKELPPHRIYDHTIPLVEGKQPPFEPLYGMSQKELQVPWEYLQDQLPKGLIRYSSSTAGAPVLFVKKYD